MLVSATEMINKAHEGHYAIAQFNINNMEWIKAILLGCEAKKSPVILGVSEGAAKYMCGYKNAVDMVNNIMDFYNITVPVAVHLDHGTYEGAKKRSKLDSRASCLMDLIIQSKKISRNQKN